MIIAMITILTLMLVFITVSFIYVNNGLGKWLYHDILKWHQPNETLTFDGCSLHSSCKYCGKEIMQDSQGNWFSIGGNI